MENPYDPGTTEYPPHPPEHDTTPIGPRASAWGGAKSGAVVAAVVAGLFASLIVVPALAVSAFGLGSGRGLAISSYVPGGIGIFLFFTAFGGLIGGTAALVAACFRRPRPVGSGAASTSEDERAPPARTADKPTGFPSTRRRRRLWPWFVGVPLLLVLAAAFILGAYVGRTVDQKLAAAIAAADQDDPYWRLDDLLAHRERVPDSLNSAPVIDRILALMPYGWPESPTANPGPSSPARAQFIKKFDSLHNSPTNFRLSESLEKPLRDELKKYDKAVTLARSLVRYPRGRHELTIAPAVIDTLLPHVQGTRGVARLLVASAVIQAHDGDISGALDSCRAIVAAGRSIGDEPFLISHLVHIAIGESALDATWRVLGQGEACDAALAALQELLLDEMKQPLLLTGVKGERAVLTEIIRRLGSGEIPFSALSDSGPSGRDGPPGAVAPWGKLWFDQQQAVALERMTEAVAIARRPVHQRPALWRVWEAEAERLKQSPVARYTDFLPLMLAPAVATASSAFSRYQTDLAANAILVAAERHRKKTGQWPESVAAIDRTILRNPPADPFTGESFRMEHHDGQLFVYSIGPNGTDEHGTYDPKRWMRGEADDAGAKAWDLSERGRKALAEPKNR
jgi:hypothetical protein